MRKSKKIKDTIKNTVLTLTMLASAWGVIASYKVLMLASWKATLTMLGGIAFLTLFFLVNYTEVFNG